MAALATAFGVHGQPVGGALGVDFSGLPHAGDRVEGASDPAGGMEKGHYGHLVSRWIISNMSGTLCCWHICWVLLA